jgi:purine-nucleoside phosphorylase
MFDESVSYLKSQGIESPQLGIILGTGLHDILNYCDVICTIPYPSIPGFSPSTVESHKGQLVYGVIEGVRTVVMQGRYHFYEGYSMQQVVFPVRVMKLLGVKHLLVSNASGGINKNFRKGDLVLVNDHINLQTANPLTGKNIDTLGPRFPDMSCPYDKRLNKLFHKAAKETNIKLKEGVYAAVNGPNLETRAEYRMLRTMGADLVGMSTVPEVIAAVHMGLPCAVVSVVTDECDPDDLKPTTLEEIIAVATQADGRLAGLWKKVISQIQSE